MDIKNLPVVEHSVDFCNLTDCRAKKTLHVILEQNEENKKTADDAIKKLEKMQRLYESMTADENAKLVSENLLQESKIKTYESEIAKYVKSADAIRKARDEAQQERDEAKTKLLELERDLVEAESSFADTLRKYRDAKSQYKIELESIQRLQANKRLLLTWFDEFKEQYEAKKKELSEMGFKDLQIKVPDYEFEKKPFLGLKLRFGRK